MTHLFIVTSNYKICLNTDWKSTRAIRKNNYSSTQVVDGTSGDANIANLFRGKYVSLFNSVESTDDELTELNEHIKSAIASKCDCPDTTGDKNHCHEIRSSDVSNAIVKMKSDKISDNGWCILITLFLEQTYYTSA